MSLPLTLRRVARSEYDDAVDWYEARQPGLGRRFIAAVEQVLARIAATPQLHSIVRGDVRKAVVSGFPYCVYYRDLGTRVVVVSVFHTSRNPTIWQRRS